MSQDYYKGSLDALPLGKSVDYPDTYSASLLEAVPRSLNRTPLGIKSTLPFHGEDIWNAYEFSWLNPKGKPVVALLECRVPATTPNIIESKSFKLYLNSFNEDKFDSVSQVNQLLLRDLSQIAGGPVAVNINILGQQDLPVGQLNGECIDHLDVEIAHYQPAPELLKTDLQKTVEKNLVSHLLKSNCLITNQPDWGSVQIHYVGPEVNPESLLQYIVSFRKHNEFHEQCVERIFCDISARCHPEKLSVLARYTRRGGLDINPFRSNFEDPPGNIRLIRQ